MAQTTPDDAKAIELALEGMLSSFEKLQERVATVRQTADDAVTAIHQLNDVNVERVYTAWIEEHGADYLQRYGAGWITRLETNARKAFGPDWKRLFLEKRLAETAVDTTTTMEHHLDEH